MTEPSLEGIDTSMTEAFEHDNKPPYNGIMTITPQLAAVWLKRRNKGNRHLSPDVVKRYAKSMREGRWIVTHQGMAFDDKGNLVDGQHRLKACVESGVTIQTRMTVDVPRETFSVMDTGRRRHASQLIDVRHRTTVAAAARILSYITGAVPADTPVHGHIVPNKVDNDVLLRVVDDWPELIDQAPAVSAAYGAARIQQSAHLAVVAQIARNPHNHLIDSWFEGIISGAGLAADDPRLVLRNRFLQGGDIKGAGSTRMARSYLLVVKAWNAYAKGKPIRMLKVNPDQEPPAVL